MNEKKENVQDFPVYRKYAGINVWFKVVDDRNFFEIKQIGSRFVQHHVNALQYPEMILIQDIINCTDDRWEPIESAIYIEVEKHLIVN